MTKLEEAQAKAEQAKRQLEQAEQEAREARAEAEAQRKAQEAEAREKLHQAILQKVLEDVLKSKPTAVMNGGVISITEGDFTERVHVELVRENTWRGNGKLRMIVGRFSNRTKQFPQRKDGAFNYAGAAEHVMQMFDEDKDHRDALNKVRAIEASNKPLAKMLNDEFGGDNVEASKYNEGKVRVGLSFNDTLTEEEARVALSAWRDLKDRVAAVKTVAERLKGNG